MTRTGARAAPRILLYHPDAAAYAALLAARVPGVDCVATTDEAEFRRELPEAEILAVYKFPVDALAAAAKLRWIQFASAGTEPIAPVRDRVSHLILTNGRGIHAAPIADYVMTAAVMLQSGFPTFFRNQQARRWERRPVVALAGRTLGVVGLGAIGQAIARRAAASGMDVIGVRRSGAPLPDVGQVYAPERLAEFLPRCDFVVLAVPVTDATRAMIGAREFAAMKPSAYLINVARGAVVDEPALIAALAGGTIAGACLDVFAVEPLPPESPLWTMPNVIVTPHIAGMRDDYGAQFTAIFADNLGRYARGEPMRNVVDPARGY